MTCECADDYVGRNCQIHLMNSMEGRFRFAYHIDLWTRYFTKSILVRRVQNGGLCNTMSTRGSGTAAMLMQEWHENLQQ